MEATFFKKLFLHGREEPFEVNGKVNMIPIGIILPNPNQPRRSFDDEKLFSLANSILNHGILQPLTVRAVEFSETDPTLPLRFQLIAGERRLRAARMVGMSHLPCIIIDADNEKSAELSIIENLQREDLGFFEEAAAISSLIDAFKMTQERAAGLLGLSQSTVANKLRLLRLTEEERRLILDAGLTERHARAFLKISDSALRCELIKSAIKRDLNVAATERLVDERLCEGQASFKDRKKAVVKDIRIFYNTINRAIDVMEQAGIDVAKEKREDEESIEFVIRISKGTSCA